VLPLSPVHATGKSTGWERCTLCRCSITLPVPVSPGCRAPIQSLIRVSALQQHAHMLFCLAAMHE
jgi:hypothetical protein